VIIAYRAAASRFHQSKYFANHRNSGFICFLHHINDEKFGLGIFSSVEVFALKRKL